MKYRITSIIIRQCLIFLIVLANIVVLGYISRNNRFYIDKDSYQFNPISRDVATGDFKLGHNGDKISIPFYNRVGYIYYNSVINQINFSQKNDSRLVIYFNFLFLSLTSFLVYLILYSITSKKSLSIGGALISNFTASSVFVSSMILNDTLAVLLLTLVVYLIIRYRNINWWSIGLFTLISTLRVEYLLICIPIFSILKPEFKKRLLFVPLFSILINLLLLIPYIDKEFVDKIFNILNTVKFDLIYFGIIGAFGLALFKYVQDHIVKILGGVTTLILLLLILKEGTTLFITTLLSFLLPIIIIEISNLLSIFRSKDINKSNNFYASFILCSIYLFIIFYKSFYFHHLVVIAPMLAIVSMLYIERLNLSKTFGKFFDRNIYKLYLAGFMIIAALFNIFIYKLVFYKYDRDVAQVVFRSVNQIVRDSKINIKDTVLASDSPEAGFYWTGISSKDIRNVNKDFDKTDNLIYISFKDEKPEFMNYKLNQEFKIPLNLNYNFYQEQVGFNPKSFNIYIFNK